MALHTRNDWNAAVTLFNGQVIHAYQNADDWGTDRCIFAARSTGETFNYPVVQNAISVNSADGPTVAGTDVVNTANSGYDVNENDIETTDLAVDQPMKAIRYLGLDQIDVRPDLRLPTHYAMMLGRAIAEGKGIRLTGMLAKAANDGTFNQEVDVDLAGATSEEGKAALLKSEFNRINSEMDKEGVPATGRYGMLRSRDWYSLMDSRGIYGREYGGQAQVQRPGQVIVYANIDIQNGRNGFGLDTTSAEYATNRGFPTHYQYNMSNLAAVVWHEESWAMRHWTEPKTMVDWSTDYDAYKTEARLQMGAVAIDMKPNQAFPYRAVHTLIDAPTP